MVLEGIWGRKIHLVLRPHFQFWKFSKWNKLWWDQQGEWYDGIALSHCVCMGGIKCFHRSKGFWKRTCSYNMFVQNRTLVEVRAWPCCLFRHPDAAGSTYHLRSFATFTGKIWKLKSLPSTLHHKLVSTFGNSPHWILAESHRFNIWILLLGHLFSFFLKHVLIFFFFLLVSLCFALSPLGD